MSDCSPDAVAKQRAGSTLVCLNIRHLSPDFFRRLPAPHLRFSAALGLKT